MIAKKLLSKNKNTVFLVNKRWFSRSVSCLKIVPFNLADIGEGITKCEIIEFYVNLNDQINEFDKVCEVQSDKATVEITSRFTGTVKKLYYKKGEMAEVGSPLIDVDVEEESVPEVMDQTESKDIDKVVAEIKKDSFVDFQKMDKVLATPAVRRVALENNVDLSTVKGSGRGSRILKEDVYEHVDNIKSKDAVRMVDQEREDGVKELTSIQKSMYKTMTKTLEIPHFVYSDEIKAGKLIALKEKYNKLGKANLTILPFLVKLFSVALTDYPILNASIIDEQSIRYRKEHNIGVAIDSEIGLVVPNIKNVEEKSTEDIALELSKLKKLVKDKKLQREHLTNGTITISNIGSIGGKTFHPVIASKDKEVCIVAIGRTYQSLEMTETGQITATDRINVSISADHRVIDGATVARFSNRWKYLVENIDVAIAGLK